jgi:hypothetical protein
MKARVAISVAVLTGAAVVTLPGIARVVAVVAATDAPPTDPPNDDVRVDATVVDVLTEGESSWLLVDISDGMVQGVGRLIVEVEGSRVDCDGAAAPPYLLTPGEEVSFAVVGDMATRPQPPDLRWTPSVAVVGADLRMMCPTRADLATVLDAARARWEAAGLDDYQFTLHWMQFSPLFGDFRVSVVGGQPGTINRITELDPESRSLDLSPLPATIDDVFDVIEDELDADRIIACYDTQLGYPIDVQVDRILRFDDDELMIAISELTVAGSTIPPASVASSCVGTAADVPPATETTGGVDGPVVYAAVSSFAETALGSGTVELAGQCLLLGGAEVGGTGRPVIVWQFETSWSDDESEVILPDLSAVLVGSTISAGGGFHGADQLDEFLSDPAALEQISECVEYDGTDNVFVIQGAVEVTS